MRRSAKSGAMWAGESTAPLTSSRAWPVGTGCSAIAQVLQPSARCFGDTRLDSRRPQQRGRVLDLAHPARGVPAPAVLEPLDERGADHLVHLLARPVLAGGG